MESIDRDISTLRDRIRSLLGTQNVDLVAKLPKKPYQAKDMPAERNNKVTSQGDIVGMSLDLNQTPSATVKKADEGSQQRPISLLSPRGDEDKKQRRKSASSPLAVPTLRNPPQRKGRKPTVPQAPKFVLDAKYGEKVPSPSVKEDMGDDGSSVFSYSTWGTQSTKRTASTKRATTVPQAPMFLLDMKYGEKVASPSVKGEDDHSSTMSNLSWGTRSTSRTPNVPQSPSPSVKGICDDVSLLSVSTRGTKSTSRTPTVPTSPRFALDAKYGEKFNSASTKETVRVDDNVSLLTFSTHGSRSNKTPTKPPSVASSRASSDHGDALRIFPGRPRAGMNRTLTVPQEPSFALDAKYGKKSSSPSLMISPSNNDHKSAKSGESHSSASSSTTTTVPKSPKFACDRRFGKRHSSASLFGETSSLASSTATFLNSLRTKSELKSSPSPGKVTVPVATKINNRKPTSSEEPTEQPKARSRAVSEARRKRRKKRPSVFSKSSLDIAETIEEEGESEDEVENVDQLAEDGSCFSPTTASSETILLLETQSAMCNTVSNKEKTSKAGVAETFQTDHDPFASLSSQSGREIDQSPSVKPSEALILSKNEEERAVQNKNEEPLGSMGKDISALRSRLRALIGPSTAQSASLKAEPNEKMLNIESSGTLETVSSDSTEDGDDKQFPTILNFNGTEKAQPEMKIGANDDPSTSHSLSKFKLRPSDSDTKSRNSAKGSGLRPQRCTLNGEDKSITTKTNASSGSKATKESTGPVSCRAARTRSSSNPRRTSSAKDSIENTWSPSAPKARVRRDSDILKKKNGNKRRDSDPTSLRAYQTTGNNSTSSARKSIAAKEARNRRLTYPIDRKTTKSSRSPAKTTAQIEEEEMKKQFKARKMPSFKLAPEIKTTKASIYSSIKHKRSPGGIHLPKVATESTPPRSVRERKSDYTPPRVATRSTSVGHGKRSQSASLPTAARVKSGRKSLGDIPQPTISGSLRKHTSLTN
mmetsp:Transcript_20685/g.57132  ORF Transcript_20685/g.57132 Transcript_20685/m.57132 type:complete len:989 (+) Transcript_20685:112-3078(+)